MIDSLLDSIAKKVDKIHNVTDIAVEETRKLAKVVTSSEKKIREAEDATLAVQDYLESAVGKLAQLRTSLKEAEDELEVAKFQALETNEVMNTLESLTGNAAQLAQPESKQILVENDPRLFEQSASMLNEKDLRRAIGRLKMERVYLLYALCSDLIQSETNDVELS